MKIVEYYIGFGYGSGSWITKEVKISEDIKMTPEEYVDKLMMNQINDFDDVVAFWGIYNIRDE